MIGKFNLDDTPHQEAKETIVAIQRLSITLAEAQTKIDRLKASYLDARRDCQSLAQALEFIRDCEDDGEEMGPLVTVSFLKEQARAALERTPL